MLDGAHTPGPREQDLENRALPRCVGSRHSRGGCVVDLAGPCGGVFDNGPCLCQYGSRRSPADYEGMDFIDEYRPGFSRAELRAGNGALASFDGLIASRSATWLSEHSGKWPATIGPTLWPQRDPLWPEWLGLPANDGTQYAAWSARAVGWPALCLCSRTRVATTGTQTVTGSLQVLGPAHYAGRVTPSDPGLGSIPLLPIWRGLAIDGAMFSVAWAAVLVPTVLAYRKIRASRRRLRGLCLACGYDLRAEYNTPCPECGVTQT